MPYITQERRFLLTRGEAFPLTKGELNFLLTHTMHQYVLNHGKSYQTLSDTVGAANDAATEFRRQILDPYEDQKKLENGNISSLDESYQVLDNEFEKRYK